MAFDFNAEPLRLYGIMPQTPFPLEVSIYGYCQMSCSFCFANRNRDASQRELNPVNSAPSLFRKIERSMEDEHSPIGFFLREKYPICFSNTTDPFQRAEKQYRATEAFLGWAKANRTPLFIQTRGNVLYEEFDRYAPSLVPGKDVVYISICQQDDDVRKKQEPGAMSIEKRWELARRLSDKGIPVIAACNPYLAEWVPDIGKYCEDAKAAGCRGIWWEHLHFTAAQGDCLALPYRELLFKGNLAPMYTIGILKRWYAATEAAGLDFFPTPRWDAYFGHKAKHPECADPAWLGGKTMDFAFRIVARLYRIMQESGKMVMFGWPEIESAMRALNVPNPLLSTSDFWYPFNAQVKADRESWNARLGKAAPFYEVMRYFWNHPWESHNFLWYHPFMQSVYYGEKRAYAVDKEGDIVGLFDPKFNKHHGKKEHEHDTIDWGKTLWPKFAGKPEAVPA